MAAHVGADAARQRVKHGLCEAIEELVRVVGGGLREDQLPGARPQPRGNPGVVEPAVDARALYRALTRTVRPAMEHL